MGLRAQQHFVSVEIQSDVRCGLAEVSWRISNSGRIVDAFERTFVVMQAVVSRPW